jgi:hypothetical protein
LNPGSAAGCAGISLSGVGTASSSAMLIGTKRQRQFAV